MGEISICIKAPPLVDRDQWTNLESQTVFPIGYFQTYEYILSRKNFLNIKVIEIKKDQQLIAGMVLNERLVGYGLLRLWSGDGGCIIRQGYVNLGLTSLHRALIEFQRKSLTQLVIFNAPYFNYPEILFERFIITGSDKTIQVNLEIPDWENSLTF